MPTDRCNSRCKHCNIWKQKSIPNPLTLEEIEKALSDPLFKDVKEIINTGGEPILRQDIEEIVLIEHKCLPKAKLQLSTNALLPDRVLNLAKSLLEKGIPISVGVSLDGIGEKHDYIRGVKGNFQKADYLLHELLKLKKEHRNKLEIGIGFTLSDLTLDSLDPVREYAKKLNIELLIQWYNQSPFYGNIKMDIAKNKELTKAVQSLIPSFLQEMWLNWLEGKFIKFPCFALYTFCVLKWDGAIVPCLNYFDKSIGNIREKSPTEIWQSPEAKKIRKIVKSCPGCLNEWCTGWSFESCMFPVFSYYLKRPDRLLHRLTKRGI